MGMDPFGRHVSSCTALTWSLHSQCSHSQSTPSRPNMAFLCTAAKCAENSRPIISACDHGEPSGAVIASKASASRPSPHRMASSCRPAAYLGQSWNGVLTKRARPEAVIRAVGCNDSWSGPVGLGYFKGVGGWGAVCTGRCGRLSGRGQSPGRGLGRSSMSRLRCDSGFTKHGQVAASAIRGQQLCDGHVRSIDSPLTSRLSVLSTLQWSCKPRGGLCAPKTGWCWKGRWKGRQPECAPMHEASGSIPGGQLSQPSANRTVQTAVVARPHLHIRVAGQSAAGRGGLGDGGTRVVAIADAASARTPTCLNRKRDRAPVTVLAQRRIAQRIWSSQAATGRFCPPRHTSRPEGTRPVLPARCRPPQPSTPPAAAGVASARMFRSAENSLEEKNRPAVIHCRHPCRQGQHVVHRAAVKNLIYLREKIAHGRAGPELLPGPPPAPTLHLPEHMASSSLLMRSMACSGKAALPP